MNKISSDIEVLMRWIIIQAEDVSHLLWGNLTAEYASLTKSYTKGKTCITKLHVGKNDFKNTKLT